MQNSRFDKTAVFKAASILVLAVVILTLAPVKRTYAAAFVVTKTADTNDGACNADCSLREAIGAANASAGADTITFAPALNGLPIVLTIPGDSEDGNASGDLDITGDLTLNGSGETATVIDGGALDRVFHVVSGSVTINDLTVRNGRTPNGADATDDCYSFPCFPEVDGSDGQPGGGIWNAGTLTLNRVTLVDNQTGSGGTGGDLYCSNFGEFCSAGGGDGGDGGAVYSTGSLTINDSTLNNNQTGAGGAPGTDNCSVDAICSTSSGSRGDGGAIDQTTASGLTVTASSLAANMAAFGGGISCFGVCTISDSTISGNAADSNGGGIYFIGSGNKSVTNTTVHGNTAGSSGGGVYGNAGTLNITNSTISGNYARSSGGGIIANGSNPVNLNHVTVTNNRVQIGDGGGISRNLYTFNIKNSIVADNIDDGGQGPDCRGTVTSLGYNHVETTTGCTLTPTTGDITGVDPALDALADNGGPTRTHRPTAVSPVLNAIPAGTSDCGTVNTVDQRGAARPYGGGCDKGAVEMQSTITAGVCGGPDLTGVQNFAFGSGNTLTLDVNAANGLNCVTIEEMGPGVNHLRATPRLQTGNWWHISGNISSGFDANLTLPYVGANADTRVCRWPGNLGGAGWDCGDALTHTAGANAVTRTGVTSFSDWTVGQDPGPTAVTLQSLSAGRPAGTAVLLYALLALLLSFAWLRRRTAR
ncbi:MAG: CSLREA domain-containing protein [Anaerolineales bacterium]|nr:CSLREA domain-containing protein [Anaerolineales bacterium]